jgi:hypothetical protein
MWIAEQLLFQGARALSRTEIAHSSEMKTALESIDALGVYRASEIRKVSEAAGRYSIPIVDSVVLDFGSNDGALSAEYLQRGATRVIGVDVDQGAIKRAQSRHQDDRLVFIHSDVGAIPLPDQCVDASVSCDVFEHVSKPAVEERYSSARGVGGIRLLPTFGRLCRCPGPISSFLKRPCFESAGGFTTALGTVRSGTITIPTARGCQTSIWTRASPRTT